MTQLVDAQKISPPLSQLLESLAEFESVLDQEETILKSTDISPLTDLLKQKETLSDQVNRQFSDVSNQFSNDLLSLNEFIQLDSYHQLPSTIQKQIKQAIELATTCHEKNIRNGMTVQSLNNINQAFLNLFTGQDPNAQTYGAQGQAKHGESNKANPLGKA